MKKYLLLTSLLLNSFMSNAGIAEIANTAFIAVFPQLNKELKAEVVSLQETMKRQQYAVAITQIKNLFPASIWNQSCASLPKNSTGIVEAYFQSV